MADGSGALRDYIAATAAVTTLLSKAALGVRLDFHPQSYNKSALPLIDIMELTTSPERHLTNNSGLTHTLCQVDVIAILRSDIVAVSEQVRLACEHYRGTVGSVEILDIEYQGSRDAKAAPIDGSEDFARIRSMTLRVTHAEAVTSN